MEIYDSFLVKFSLFDAILTQEGINTFHSRELYFFMISDLLLEIKVYFPIVSYFFVSNYQDSLLILFNFSPELVLALDSFVNNF